MHRFAPVFIFHSRWVGEIQGEERSVNICTAIILRDGKGLFWTDHADMEGFRS